MKLPCQNLFKLRCTDILPVSRIIKLKILILMYQIISKDVFLFKAVQLYHLYFSKSAL